jgi:glycine cleavage system pyridoxal-binding protein P
MEALGVKVVVGPANKAGNQKDLAGVLLQYPNTKGAVLSYGTLGHSCDVLRFVVLS